MNKFIASLFALALGSSMHAQFGTMLDLLLFLGSFGQTCLD